MAEARHHLVGGGIASLAAAVFLIRDAGASPDAITIHEARDVPGGALDGAGDPDRGYLTRGGRMFEPGFACTFDLMRAIPAPGGGDLLDELEAFNREFRSSSRCRIVRGGRRIEAPRLGLGLAGTVELLRFLARPESALAGRRIDDLLGPAVLDSDFWLMWSTTFSFRPWHDAAELRRYCRRFAHLLPGFSRLEGILRTPLNQHDSLVAPIADWLTGQGVRILTGSEAIDVEAAPARRGARRR